jgi:hypothetical protein
MRLLFVSLLAACCGFFTTPSRAVSIFDQQAQEIAEVGPAPARDIAAESELYCMTLALYFEGGSIGEPEVGLRHIARVIVERANANRQIWGGSTICGVVFYERMGVCQFSFACLPKARRTPRRNYLWRFSAEIARDALEGENHGPSELIRYYMNADYTPLKNQCRFQKEFVPVAKAGRHEFFREPTSLERRALMRSEPEACQRWQAEIEEAKRKAEAKRLAKKKGKKGTAVAKGKGGKGKVAQAKGKPGKGAKGTIAQAKPIQIKKILANKKPTKMANQ